MEPGSQHQPVLLDKVIELLDPQAGERYLDLTAGYGGHARAFLGRIGKQQLMTLVDRDQEALKHLKSEFPEATIRHGNFAEVAERLATDKQQFDLVLLDLGVSSPQFDNHDRGFSFQGEGLLDMRMDTSQALSAADVINRFSERDIANILYEFGEERRSRPIARAIVAARPLQTTLQLASVIAHVSPHRGKIHPATRTFQALRIYVNQELESLERVLPEVLKLLSPGGRIAVISFHSLEDRIVKRFMKAESQAGNLELLHKKIIPGKLHDVTNPRARSAKLRSARKK